jgi:putative oxidoreductase
MESSFKFHSDDLGKLILRLAVAGLMLFHGISKVIHGIGWMPPMLNQNGLPGFIGYGVYVGEVLAPLLLIAGWQTRLASLVVAFDMLVAAWLVHRQDIFTVRAGSGGWSIELEAFYFLGAMALFLLGAGKYSISRGQGRWD